MGDGEGKRDPSSSLPEGCPVHSHFNGPYNALFVSFNLHDSQRIV